MYYCGNLKKLKKYGFKKYVSVNDVSYYYSDNDDSDINIIISKDKKIKISTNGQAYDNLPDVILKLYNDELIKLGEKEINFKNIEIQILKKKDVFVIQVYNDKFYKKKFQLKTFYYRNHEFFIWGTIKNGYTIGDVLTGCFLDYKIKHINTLYYLKEGNPLDKYLQSILLNTETYRSAIYRLKETKNYTKGG